MLIKRLSFINTFLVLLTILGAWQVLIDFSHIPAYFLPSPMQVFFALSANASVLLQAMKITLLESLLGLLLAVLLGGLLALAIVYSRAVRLAVLPIVILSQALPTFAVAPLLVLWLGYGISSKIAITTLMLFFPITSNSLDGLQQTPKAWLEMAEIMQAKPLQILWRIRLPAALPKFASGLRVATAGAPLGAVIGEWVGSNQGLGFLILESNSRLQVDLMFAALALLIALSLLLYYGIDKILTLCLQW